MGPTPAIEVVALAGPAASGETRKSTTEQEEAGFARFLDLVSESRSGNEAGYYTRFRMLAQASARFAKIAPRKARMIANLVRGRDAAEAIQLLNFTLKSGAPVICKVIESAVANAKEAGADVDNLFVSKATVDKGPNKFFRRWRPRAMGRATRVTKGVSHIVIELAERKAK